jgi:O-antigen/teichoic acid export membrane protein
MALFIADITIGRLLGTSGFGIYSSALAIVTILMVVSMLGIENLLIREVAISIDSGSTAYIHRIVRWSLRTTLGIAVGIAVALSTVILLFNSDDNQSMMYTILAGLLLLPMLIVSNISGVVLRGLHRILTGQFVQYVVQPIVLVSCVGFYYLNSAHLTPVIAMLISAVGWLVAMVIAIVMLIRNMQFGSEGEVHNRDIIIFRRALLVFAIIAGVQITNARIDILMLYWFIGESEAGIYSAMVRICDLLVFSIIAINISIGPTLACLYHGGEKKKLQKLITHSARISSIFALPIIMMVALFTNFSMGLFGKGFVVEPLPLIFLCASQAVVVLTGSKALLLVMTRNERSAALVLGLTAIGHVVISFLLVPSLGIVGAAIATSSSIVCWSIWMTVLAARRIQIDTTVFGRFVTHEH